ncbi:MAG: hypothetical protein K2Q01_07595 [Rickettsiales bacterium]|nr:hypothetical protein [Rickettsiales bacterium]
MSYNTGQTNNQGEEKKYTPNLDLSCNWEMLREQLLQQWALISETDLDVTGPNSKRIAMLIERKYGIASGMIENYLQNFIRTMPLQ